MIHKQLHVVSISNSESTTVNRNRREYYRSSDSKHAQDSTENIHNSSSKYNISHIHAGTKATLFKISSAPLQHVRYDEDYFCIRTCMHCHS